MTSTPTTTRNSPEPRSSGVPIPLDFGVFGVPETFFVDRTGRIVAKITGPSNYALLSRVLDAMLVERQPQSEVAGPVQPAPDR